VERSYYSRSSSLTMVSPTGVEVKPPLHPLRDHRLELGRPSSRRSDRPREHPSSLRDRFPQERRVSTRPYGRSDDHDCYGYSIDVRRGASAAKSFGYALTSAADRVSTDRFIGREIVAADEGGTSVSAIELKKPPMTSDGMKAHAPLRSST